jgi:hypothetical protein|nr:MAG TPA: hypothetical protein [Caudoviricetes sp.]
MENFMFWGMFIACLLISAMTYYILNLQRMVNNDLQRKYNDLEQELSRVLGWERYDWANNFNEYARKVEELIRFKDNLERLEIIQKALDVQKLEELQERKKLVEREIEKLEK